MPTAKSAVEVIEILKIKDRSTLTKWCLALEKEGYIFTRVEQNKRLFYEKDIEVLKQFEQLRKELNLPYEQTAKAIMLKLPAVEDEEVFQHGTTSVPAVNEVFQVGTTSIPVEFLAFMEQYLEQKFEQQKLEIKQTMQEEIKELKEQINHHESKAVEELRTSLKEIATAKEKKGLVTKIKKFFGKK